jgi:hypothetical protein
MKVDTSVVGVRMPIPPAFPGTIINALFDVVHREIIRREPPDIDTNCSHRVRVSVSVEGALQQPSFVWIRLEVGFMNEWIRRELLSKQA